MNPRQRIAGGVLWIALFVAVTVVMISGRGYLRTAHSLLPYMLLVIGATVAMGRIGGAAMAVAGFIAIDWLFIHRANRASPAGPADDIILASFLAGGLLISELITSYRRRSEFAELRVQEMERQSEKRRTLAEAVSRARALQEAESVKSALLASVAHDLRAPLATIRVLASRGGALEADIAAETERLTRYLDALLAFVRTEGAITPRRDPNVAEDLIGAAVRSVEAAIGAREVVVRTPPDGEILLGDFDFALALRALANLIENAARYSPPDQAIEVELGWVQDRLSIQVFDRGPGLAPDEADRVFNPFKRGAASAGREGSGLGLAIARTFARAQDGDVRYAPRPGGGAIFIMELPSRTRAS